MAVKRLAYVREDNLRDDAASDVKEYRRRYLAELTSPRNPGAQIVLHAPFLGRWQPHPDDPQAKLVSLEVTARKHTLIYDVLADYSTDIAIPENPLDEPADIDVTTQTIALPITRDALGEPIVNTAGSLVEGIEEDFDLPVFSVSKKIGRFPQWLLTYPQAVNSDVVRMKGLICEPRTLKIGRIRIGSEDIQDDTPFMPLSMELVHNPFTWDRWFLNRGFEEVAVVTTQDEEGELQEVLTRIRCLDEDQEPITEPAFLDEDGRRPRVTLDGRAVTLQQEREQQLVTKLKHPLDPEDIIVLRRQTRKALPFRVLPLR
jgi:hypothetical protein